MEGEIVNFIQDWVIDALFNYYTCPLWKVPLNQFIDDNCSKEDEKEIVNAHRVNLFRILLKRKMI